jgi:hypothetical protein
MIGVDSATNIFIRGVLLLYHYEKRFGALKGEFSIRLHKGFTL